MTNNKANKSKILALILGLTMCLALMLGIAMANPADTARAEETDPRTVVSTITAKSKVYVPQGEQKQKADALKRTSQIK